MRENLGAIVALLGMLLFAVSMVALIWPLKSLKLGTRKRALLGILASFFVFILGGLIMPPTTPEQIAARNAAAAEQTATRAAEAARTKAAKDKARADQVAAEFERNKVAITAAAKGMWSQITNEVGACDQAGKNVATAASRRRFDIYSLYPMVREASSLCTEAGSDVGRISIPAAIPTNQRDAFKKSIETCQNAYYAKSLAFDQMAKVLDGDTRPSALSEAKEASERSEAGAMLCSLGFLKAVNDTGVPLEDVMGDEFKTKTK